MNRYTAQHYSAYVPLRSGNAAELQLILQTLSTINCNLEILITINWNCPFLDLNNISSVALETIDCWTNVMVMLEMHTVPDQSPLCQTIIQTI